MTGRLPNTVHSPPDQGMMAVDAMLYAVPIQV